MDEPTTQTPGGEDKPNGRKRRRRASNGANLALVDPERAENLWMGSLIRNGRGQLEKTIPNATTILTYDIDWRGILSWNEFRQEIWLTAPPKWFPDDRPTQVKEGAWDDHDTYRLQCFLARRYRLFLGKEATYAAAEVVATQRVVHPVRDYLDGLRWDGVDRIDSWLTDFLGVEANDYTRMVGRCFLVAAVARVMRPGCKVDTMIILEGPQGAKKSTALKTLFGAEWFSDTPLEFASKDRFVGLRGFWGIEMAELDGMRGTDVNRIKSFLSSAADDFRKPFGHTLTRVPRRCVFAGSTNSDTYLRDTTGNRRFWPVRCGTINIEGLVGARDQLWAEAKEAYEGGAAWWPTQQVAALAAEEAAARVPESAWQPIIDAWLKTRLAQGRVSVGEALEHLGIEKARWSDERLTQQAGKALKRAGWIRRQARVDGRLQWFYFGPTGQSPLFTEEPQA